MMTTMVIPSRGVAITNPMDKGSTSNYTNTYTNANTDAHSYSHAYTNTD